MRKLTLIVLLVITTGSLVLSQEKDLSKEYNNITFGLKGGLGYNVNGFRSAIDDAGFTYYDMNPNYKTGIEFGVFATQKLRIRTFIGYNEMRYGIDGNNIKENLDYSEVKMYGFNWEINLDYCFSDKEKIDFFASPGLVADFVSSSEHKNYLTNGDINYNNYNYFTDQYPSKAVGANLSLIARIKIVDNIYMSLTPEYTLFFKKFTAGNDGMYQRLNLNLGVEYNFW